jgi:hypothetical protein
LPPPATPRGKFLLAHGGVAGYKIREYPLDSPPARVKQFSNFVAWPSIYGIVIVDMKSYLANRVGTAIGVALCVVAAWAATLVKWQSAKEFIPIVFLVFVLALGMLFGRTVGILGSIVGALMFARSLYLPLGSFRIHDQGARSGVAWMLLAGVTLSYLLLPARRDQSPKSR